MFYNGCKYIYIYIENNQGIIIKNDRTKIYRQSKIYSLYLLLYLVKNNKEDD